MFLSLASLGPAYAQVLTDNTRKGLTFSALSPSENHENSNMTSASCGETANGDRLCNPHKGDTSCDTKLPLLCILDIDAAVPTTVNRSEYWSGGVLAKSSPWRGTDIKTLNQANNICAKSFGEKWRVASFHDGGGWAIEGYGILSGGNHSRKPYKMWIDIKDQPSGTCWTR